MHDTPINGVCTYTRVQQGTRVYVQSHPRLQQEVQTAAGFMNTVRL